MIKAFKVQSFAAIEKMINCPQVIQPAVHIDERGFLTIPEGHGSWSYAYNNTIKDSMMSVNYNGAMFMVFLREDHHCTLEGFLSFCANCEIPLSEITHIETSLTDDYTCQIEVNEQGIARLLFTPHERDEY